IVAGRLGAARVGRAERILTQAAAGCSGAIIAVVAALPSHVGIRHGTTRVAGGPLILFRVGRVVRAGPGGSRSSGLRRIASSAPVATTAGIAVLGDRRTCAGTRIAAGRFRVFAVWRGRGAAVVGPGGGRRGGDQR